VLCGSRDSADWVFFVRLVFGVRPIFCSSALRLAPISDSGSLSQHFVPLVYSCFLTYVIRDIWILLRLWHLFCPCLLWRPSYAVLSFAGGFGSEHVIENMKNNQRAKACFYYALNKIALKRYKSLLF
jgi:hypothetical protein